MNRQEILNSIKENSKLVGTTWPLYSFVTSNPLAGLENKSFEQAAKQAAEMFQAKVFPEASTYKKALQEGLINEETLVRLLEENSLFESPEYYLEQLNADSGLESKNISSELDQQVVKWLSLFLDEGLAEWQMPFKNLGFYNAWKKLIHLEKGIKKELIKELPQNAEVALQNILAAYTPAECERLIQHHLAALPGWVGYIKHRADTDTSWQKKYAITLADYLAVRLWTAKLVGLEIIPSAKSVVYSQEVLKIQHVMLQAWEQTFQENILAHLDLSDADAENFEDDTLPKAQLVFCIDTRSELIRRHVEAKGNYETFGYAGFFGIAMDYHNMDDGITRKSCPPILSSAYVAAETTQHNCSEKMEVYNKRSDYKRFDEYFLRRMKNMLPSTFGFVEGSGLIYGLSLVARTLWPSKFHEIRQANDVDFESLCKPALKHADAQTQSATTISLGEKVAIVKSAFDLLGWKKFAPLVLFVGHGSHSTNNPFGSSLDCGACAASPGRHNARMLAELANEPAVRTELAEQHQIELPSETIFIGAEHNTTTDEIVIFDNDLSAKHAARLDELKTRLALAQQTAANERLKSDTGSIKKSLKKAQDWAETRPEWGLAKNAAFVIGQRNLTKKSNLDGRCFLHSYDWKTDKDGTALEGIMQGPMVVTQWINNHYYFATVDNDVFGGGSKITHNVTGNFGVVQGNLGDLKTGLPLQSVNETDSEMYHQPLRLSVIIQAPLEHVQDILSRNEHLQNLLDNQWIYLMVIDPSLHNEVIRYHVKEEWSPITELEADLVAQQNEMVYS